MKFNLAVLLLTLVALTNCSSGNAHNIYPLDCENIEHVAATEKGIPDNVSHLFPIQTGNQWGLINKNGDLVIPPKWSYIDRYSHQRAMFKDSNGKFGFLNEDGQVAVPAEYDEAVRFSDGLAAVRVRDKWGYIDLSGKMVIEPQFIAVDSFFEGFAFIVKTKSLFISEQRGGFIDKSGRWITSDNLWRGARFHNGIAIVNFEEKGKRKNAFLYPDGSMKNLGNLYAEEFQVFKSGLVPAEKKEQSILEKYYSDPISALLNESPRIYERGFINAEGKFAFPPIFSGVRSFKDCKAAVSRGHRWGLIDNKGAFLIEPTYEEPPEYLGYNKVKVVSRELPITLERTGRVAGTLKVYKIFDLNSRQLGNSEFLEIYEYHEGLSGFRNLDGMGFLDPSGNIAIEPHFDQVTQFYNGLSFVKFRGMSQYIDRTGKVIWQSRSPIDPPPQEPINIGEPEAR